MTDLNTKERFFLGVTTSLMAGLFIVWMQSRVQPPRYSTDMMIDAQSVAKIAAQMPAEEDQFILSAWDWVGRDIQYQAYGSLIEFWDSTVYCERCLLPRDVLKRGRANCVGKSLLLASLLRNRLPAERVYLAIGDLTGIGGHAWVSAQRHDGQWYILEATKPPRRWVTQTEIASRYIPEAYVNDVSLLCASEDICFIIPEASCNCRLDKS